MTTVMIAGGFDPLHVGHLDHIYKACSLGDRKIVVVQSDRNLIAKKGYVFMPETERMQILEALLITGNFEVVLNTSEDGTACNELERFRPSIYAKGGDRTPETLPPSEIETCKRLGIEIRYGVGDLLGSSSALGRNVALALMDKAGCPATCEHGRKIRMSAHLNTPQEVLDQSRLTPVRPE